MIREASPKSTQVFDFAATGPGAWNFSLMDDGLEVGKYYILHIVPKTYVFAPDTRMIAPIADLTDINYIAVQQYRAVDP